MGMSAFQKGHSFEENVGANTEHAVSIDQKLSTFRMTQCLHIRSSNLDHAG